MVKSGVSGLGLYNENLMIWGISDLWVSRNRPIWVIRISGLSESANSEISKRGSEGPGTPFRTPSGGVWEAPGHMGSGVPGPKGQEGTHPEIPSTIISPSPPDTKYPVLQGGIHLRYLIRPSRARVLGRSISWGTSEWSIFGQSRVQTLYRRGGFGGLGHLGYGHIWGLRILGP